MCQARRLKKSELEKGRKQVNSLGIASELLKNQNKFARVLLEELASSDFRADELDRTCARKRACQNLLPFIIENFVITWWFLDGKEGWKENPNR